MNGTLEEQQETMMEIFGVPKEERTFAKCLKALKSQQEERSFAKGRQHGLKKLSLDLA